MSQRRVSPTDVDPARFQPGFPLERVILERDPSEDAVPMDVVFVGGGPAGLSGAIELARLVQTDGVEGGPSQIEIGVLEKGSTLGEHCLSGAVVNPAPLRELFPELPESDFPFRGEVEAESVYLLTSNSALPTPIPPSMRNRGNRIASVCELVAWMGLKAEELGVNLFTGYPVEALLVSGGAVRGVRTAPAGLGRDGLPGPSYSAGMDVASRVTVLAEGARGLLTQGWTQWQGVGSPNPQIYSLGVKELWEVKTPLRRVIHTLGWPLAADTFGGSWIYPMGEDLVSLGLVVGLDSPDARLDVHGLLQKLKTHPLVRSLLTDGEMLEWGAKTIPEGGYYSVPERRHGDGVCLVGDAAGYVDVPSLKGIHYAIQSGILAARAIFRGLKRDDTSEFGLRSYTESVDGSFIMRDLHRTRNVRLGFRSGLLSGIVRAGAIMLTGGRFPGVMLEGVEDAEVLKELGPLPIEQKPDGKLTFSKDDAVYRSGNRTRDDIPTHLVAPAGLPPTLVEMYAHLCPAGVYERDGDQLVIRPPNCIDCKATDVLGPRWTPREGGSGPSYRRM